MHLGPCLDDHNAKSSSSVLRYTFEIHNQQGHHQYCMKNSLLMRNKVAQSLRRSRARLGQRSTLLCSSNAIKMRYCAKQGIRPSGLLQIEFPLFKSCVWFGVAVPVLQLHEGIPNVDIPRSIRYLNLMETIPSTEHDLQTTVELPDRLQELGR